MVHINNAVWAKLKTEDTISDFTLSWEKLTEYHQELYIAGVEILIIQYRMRISPIKWFWKLYYRFW